ncbi:MAG TPA: glycosyltransferase [Tepidisphaeraceae bacterium]|nr:glycosyltransferase [Tepidisphaeraceae bacterium]
MSDVPAVSAVLGVYDGERYIAESVESILNQTFRDFEFIAVDDGSTDRTVEILRKYEAKDPRMKVLQIPHGGIVDAANAGLAAARAPLIARADADDVCLPERFEKQVRYMADHPEVVCLGARMLLIEPYGAQWGESHHKLTHDEIDAELLRGSGWAMPQPVAMIRREPVMKLGGYRSEYLWVEDLDLFLRLAEVGRLANLPDYLVKYRNHTRSTNHRRPQLQLELSHRCILETYQRRGLPVPDNVRQISPFEYAWFDKYINWAWAALLKGKNPAGAREHALRALRLKPFNSLAWRTLYCAVRGH